MAGTQPGSSSRRALLLVLLAAAAGAALLGAASSASALTYSNPAPIAINDDSTATPYPSKVTVSGENFINDVNVTLFDIGHSFPDDIHAVLVAPNGDALQLMSGAGGATPVTNVDLLFSDEVIGGTELPNTTVLTSGDYVPTSWDPLESYPAPGPFLAYGNPGPVAGGTATLDSAFDGDNANGNWKLFVRDVLEDDDGVIAGGWSLTVASTGSAPPGPPNLTGTNPPSGSNANNLSIIGDAPGADNVQLHRSANCSGAPEQIVPAAALAAGIAVSVADNTTTSFSARSTNANGPSLCSDPISYTESTPSATPPTTNPPATPPGQAKKKCKKKMGKKGAVVAKKKCKRKKKK
jgi:subtilisin-like proprotein convertase family protein